MTIEFNIPLAKELYLKLKKDYDADLANRLAEENSVITEKASMCAEDIIAKIATDIQYRFVDEMKAFVVDFNTFACMPGHYTIANESMNVAIAKRIAEEFNKRGYVVDQHSTNLSITVPDLSSCIEE